MYSHVQLCKSCTWLNIEFFFSDYHVLPLGANYISSTSNVILNIDFFPPPLCPINHQVPCNDLGFPSFLLNFQAYNKMPSDCY